MTDEQVRAIRYGILVSMQDIRRQLMVRGEWDDPTVLPHDALNTALLRVRHPGRGQATDLYQHARHTHTLRWMMRQERKQRAA